MGEQKWRQLNNVIGGQFGRYPEIVVNIGSGALSIGNELDETRMFRDVSLEVWC